MVGYLQDVYLDVAVAMEQVPDKWAAWPLRESLSSVSRRFGRLIVLSEDMKHMLITSGVASDRIDLVPDWADPETIYLIQSGNVFRQRHELEGRFAVMQ